MKLIWVAACLFVSFCVNGAILPKVALKCGKHPNYKDTNTDSWVQDPRNYDFCGSIDTLSNQVFDLCKLFYPQLETDTISEASAKEFVPNFCDVSGDSTSCFGHQFICHKHNFAARSLLVPQNCTFGHAISEECSTEESLKILAQHECRAKQNPPFVLHDFGVLPPACKGEVGKYSGVEFVCCPPRGAILNKNKQRMDEYEKAQSTVCRMPAESGPCFESDPAWYFDARNGTCFMFRYGGCSGNDNRFDSKQKCLDACLPFAVKRTQEEKIPAGEGEDLIQVYSGSGQEEESSDDESQSKQTSHQDNNNREVDILAELPYLLGGEPREFFKAKIADVNYLREDYELPLNLNEHQAYTKALVSLEDSYEENMARLMHDYEKTERQFVKAVQSSGNTMQLSEAFQRQIVQLYEVAVRDLERQYREVKTDITVQHRDRVAQHKRDKLNSALQTVQLIVHSSDHNIVKEDALMAAVTKYVDLEQGVMADEESHLQRVASLSYDRAALEHRQVLDNVYAAHEQGQQVCQTLIQMDGLSFTFKSQLNVVMGEFDDYFSKILSNLNDVTKSIGVNSAGKGNSETTAETQSSHTDYFFNNRGAINLPKQPTNQDKPKLEIEQSGVFAARYMDKMPGLMKSETFEEVVVEKEGHHGFRQKITLIAFASMFVAAVVATILISVFRKRGGRSRGCGSRTFVRVESSPHPLSPEDKHINSLQVTGYYNPIYKFFDGPQET